MATSNPQNRNIVEAVVQHYETCLRSGGDEGQVVGWRDRQSQNARFEIINQLLSATQFSTVCDLGCGRGGLLDALRAIGFLGQYIGVDASQEMVFQARKHFVDDRQSEFVCQENPCAADVVVASGIFNVRLNFSDDEWTDYVYQTILDMWKLCEVGIVFNALSLVSDPRRRSRDLYYVDPVEIFRFCLTLSPDIRLAHHYGLYDLAIAVFRN